MRRWRWDLVMWALMVAVQAGAALPDGWSGRDVGPCIEMGSGSEADGVWTLKGSGRDIGGAADSFRFVWQTLKGDGSVTARVVSLAGGGEWAKAGVMLRGSLDREDAFALAAVTPTHGVRLVHRPQAAAAAQQSEAQMGGPAPCWVRLERAGSKLTASCSADGRDWKPVGEATVSLPLVAYVGLALTSAQNTQLATATFDNVAVTRAAGDMPAPWKAADLGQVEPAGESAHAAGKWTLSAAGADMWDPADNGHFVHQKLAGDGTITALVARLDAVDPWSKGGVMIRESLDPSAAQIMTVVTGGNGVHVQWRPSQGGACGDNAENAGAGAPYWVRLERRGDTFIGSCSKDGKGWSKVYQTDIKMAKDVLVGLCLTSHNEAQATTAEMTDVTVTQG